MSARWSPRSGRCCTSDWLQAGSALSPQSCVDGRSIDSIASESLRIEPCTVGAQSDLPTRNGACKRRHQHFTRRAEKGVRQRLFDTPSRDRDNAYVTIDSRAVHGRTAQRHHPGPGAEAVIPPRGCQQPRAAQDHWTRLQQREGCRRASTLQEAEALAQVVSTVLAQGARPNWA